MEAVRDGREVAPGTMADAQPAAAFPRDVLAAADLAQEARAVSIFRLGLALAALIVAAFDAPIPQSGRFFSHAVIGGYIVYALAIVVFRPLRDALSRSLKAHWIDLLWHTLMVAATGGVNSPIAIYFYVDVALAGIWVGIREAIVVAAVAAATHWLISFHLLPQGAHELDEFLSHPFYILMIGLVVAFWAGETFEQRRRGITIRQLSAPLNPRLGVQYAMNHVLQLVRMHFDAERCLLLIDSHADQQVQLYDVRRDGSGAPPPLVCPSDFKALLLMPEISGVLARTSWRPWRRGTDVILQNIASGATSTVAPDAVMRAVHALDTLPLVSVPVRFASFSGRAFVAGSRVGLRRSDLLFMSHALHTGLQAVDHARVVDRLVDFAAQHERDRLARGIHDTVVQSLVGLGLSLRAIMHRLDAGAVDVGADVARVAEALDEDLARARDRASGIKADGSAPDVVLRSISDFAERFSRATGIEVSVVGPRTGIVWGRLGAQVFEIISEGLSNVRRHAHARRATVVIEPSSHELNIRIENDTPGSLAPDFIPRSLQEHADSLGGVLHVRRTSDSTVVTMTIPL